jgi:hypothetical protein
MAEIVEIPDLFDPYLMELSVCAKLRLRGTHLSQPLKKLEDNRLTARAEGFEESSGGLFVELFSGGKVKNHLHVNLLLRPNIWKRTDKLSPILEIQSSLGTFVGVRADTIVGGEFLVPTEDLAKNSFIRSATKYTKIAGIRATRTSETFSAEPSGTFYRLRWTKLESNYFAIVLEIKRASMISPTYLRESKAAVMKSFRDIIHVKK